MTREELQKRLESAEKQMIGLQDEIQNLKTKLAEAQGEPEIPDFPTFKTGGEDSWHMDSCLNVTAQEYAYGKTTGDYNFFHTKEMAQEFADKCKLIAMMLHCKYYLDRYYVPNWDNRDEIKWDVCFDSRTKKFSLSNWRNAQYSSVYFSSDVAAKKCADWLNEHWRDSE